MATSPEQTPLLPTTTPGSSAPLQPSLRLNDLDILDAAHLPDDVLDDPPTPSVCAVKRQLMAASCPHGCANPVHEQMNSPALLLRLRQAVDYGFRNVMSACRQAFTRLVTSQKAVQPATSTTSTSTSPSPSPSPSPSSTTARARTVRAVFVMAIFTMLAMTAVSPTLLLYMNHTGLTSSTHIAPYVIAAALGTAVPVVSNLLLTFSASLLGPGRALAIGSLVAAGGILLFATARGSSLFFMLGYGLYASCNSFRVVRVSLLSKVVPPKDRTTVLATHALMTPLGALAGPPVWILAQIFRGQTHMDLFGITSIVLDRFSIVYGVTLLAMLAIYAIAATGLRRIVPYSATEEEEEEQVGETELKTDKEDQLQEDGSNDEQQSSTPSPIAAAPLPQDHSGADGDSVRLRPAVVRFADGQELLVNLNTYRNRVFGFFCLIMLGVNMSAGIYMTAFQPVLVNVFHVSDAKLGVIYECIAVFAVIPPLLVAVLSRRLMDRQILVIGLLIKLVGMALFLPVFGGQVYEAQVIVGFLLIIKASIFFSTASMSLFTKILGPMSTSFLLGLLASASSIGPAVAQILLSSRIVNWFGSASFGLFALPALGSLLAILYPLQYRRLDPSCEFISLVTQEAEIQQSAA